MTKTPPVAPHPANFAIWSVGGGVLLHSITFSLGLARSLDRSAAQTRSLREKRSSSSRGRHRTVSRIQPPPPPELLVPLYREPAAFYEPEPRTTVAVRSQTVFHRAGTHTHTTHTLQNKQKSIRGVANQQPAPLVVLAKTRKPTATHAHNEATTATTQDQNETQSWQYERRNGSL